MDKKQQEQIKDAIDQRDLKLFREILILTSQMSPLAILAFRQSLHSNIHIYLLMAEALAKEN